METLRPIISYAEIFTAMGYENTESLAMRFVCTSRRYRSPVAFLFDGSSLSQETYINVIPSLRNYRLVRDVNTLGVDNFMTMLIGVMESLFTEGLNDFKEIDTTHRVEDSEFNRIHVDNMVSDIRRNIARAVDIPLQFLDVNAELPMSATSVVRERHRNNRIFDRDAVLRELESLTDRSGSIDHPPRASFVLDSIGPLMQNVDVSTTFRSTPPDLVNSIIRDYAGVIGNTRIDVDNGILEVPEIQAGTDRIRDRDDD